MGACSIQGALDVLNTEDDNTHLLDNIETWNCVLGKDMNTHMFDLIEYSSIKCKLDCKVLMGGYEVFRSWMLEHTGLDIDHYVTIQSPASDFMLKWLL